MSKRQKRKKVSQIVEYNDHKNSNFMLFNLKWCDERKSRFESKSGIQSHGYVSIHEKKVL